MPEPGFYADKSKKIMKKEDLRIVYREKEEMLKIIQMKNKEQAIERLMYG